MATSKTNIPLSRKTTTISRLLVDHIYFNFATSRLCQILRLCRFSVDATLKFQTEFLYHPLHCGILGPGILWDMGPRIPASQPALAGVGCGARGGRRRKDECPAYHGPSYRGPSRLTRTLATTASRAESLKLACARLASPNSRERAARGSCPRRVNHSL